MVACKIHSGRPSASGYGRVGQKYAHRVAYEETYGPIPDGLCVLHRCDVRLCVEPTHLFLGTRSDNNKDRAEKGRSRPRRGEKNGRCVLNDKQVAALRKDTGSHRALAAKYGISKSQVGRLIRGELR